MQGGEGAALAELGMGEEDCKPRMALLIFAMTLEIALKVWFTAFSNSKTLF